MKILFLTHYFPPEVNAPATRTFEHAKRWAAAGHEVVVITGFPSQPFGIIYPGYKKKLWQWDQMDGVRVLRIWTYISANKGFLKRIINYVSFMKMAVLYSLFLRRPDVVIATSPHLFSACAGWAVSVLKWRPFVFELRDIWPESIVAVGAMKKGLVIRFFEWYARFLYRRASLVVAVTESFKDILIKQGIPAEKVKVVTNGVDLANFQPTGKRDEFRAEKGWDGKFVCGYIGTIGMAHHVETMVRAAELLKDRDDISLFILGDGAGREQVEVMIAEKQLTNIRLFPQVPREVMVRYLEACDASAVLLKKQDIFTTVIPSKIFECMAMRKPIIMGVEGEACKILTDADCCIPITPQGQDELADAIKTLAADVNEARRLGENGYKAVSTKYTRESMAIKMLSEVETAALRDRPSLLGRWVRTVRHMRWCQYTHRMKLEMAGQSKPMVMSGHANEFLASAGRIEWLARDHAKQGMYSVPGIMADKFRFLNREKQLALDEFWSGHRDMSPLWNFNLHYFEYLVHLDARRDPKCAKKGAALIADWISHAYYPNRYGWHPYTVSLRLRNWTRFILNNPEFITYGVGRSMGEQTGFLARNTETHLLANHYLENLITLVWMGLYFNNQELMARFEPRLEKELTEQTDAAGGHCEHAPTYHLALFETLVDLKKIYSLRGPVPAWLETRVAVWGAYIDQLASRQGIYPLLGDSALGVAATVPQLVKYAGIPAVSKLPRAFDLSGILGLETEDWYAVMNGAEPAPAYNPGHAHSDMLSFELYFRGKPVIVDTGVYGYEGNPYRWQERFTRAHNTVMVDDREIHEVWGAFRVGRRSRGIVTAADTAKMRISAGYTNRPNTVKRAMAVENVAVTITDEFIFMPKYRFVTRFHFAPGLKVTLKDATCAFEGNGIKGDLTGPANAVTYIEEYACCREFGKRAAGQCLVVTGITAGQEYKITCKESPDSGNPKL